MNGAVHFVCRANGTCDSFDLQWYRRKNTDNDITIMIESGGDEGRYKILKGDQIKFNISTSDGSDCHISSTLIFYNFNYDDNGYYWCQIIANGCLLQPSPRQYTEVNVNMAMNSTQTCKLSRHFIPAICAENDTSLDANHIMGCPSLSASKNLVMETPKALITIATIISQDSEDPVPVTFEGKDIDPENMTWLYYGSAAIVLMFIIFIVVLSVVVGVKFRNKQSKIIIIIMDIITIKIMSFKL